MRKRILIDKEIRRKIFRNLKEYYKLKTLKELASKLNISYSCLKKWIDGYCYVPEDIFPKNFLNKEVIIDEQIEGWGRSKGGKIGIKRLWEKYPVNIRRKWSIKGGNASRENLIKLGRKFREIITKKAKLKKLEKRTKRIEQKIELNKGFFENNYPRIIISNLSKSIQDVKDGLDFPVVLDENLAEEIGLHIGDGTLLEKRNYFALRGYAEDEYDYYQNYIKNLYKTVYNFTPNIFLRGNLCGFEKSSRLLFSFKHFVLGIPSGEKTRIIDIPELVKNSRNEKIIAACIRGILDSDGCIWFSKNGKYPRIEIDSQSKKLIGSVAFYLEKMGFEPSIDKSRTNITLYGEPMLKLWMEKIGTNHPKHKLKIEIWEKFGRCPPKLSYKKLKQIVLNDALVM